MVVLEVRVVVLFEEMRKPSVWEGLPGGFCRVNGVFCWPGDGYTEIDFVITHWAVHLYFFALFIVCIIYHNTEQF